MRILPFTYRVVTYTVLSLFFFFPFRLSKELPSRPPGTGIQPRDINCRLIFIQCHQIGRDVRTGTVIENVTSRWELVSVIVLGLHAGIADLVCFFFLKWSCFQRKAGHLTRCWVPHQE